MVSGTGILTYFFVCGEFQTAHGYFTLIHRNQSIWMDPLFIFAPFSLFSFHFNFAQVEKDQTIDSYIWTIKTLRLVSFKREQQ